MEKRGDSRVGTDLKPPPPTWLNRYRREAGVSQMGLSSATCISERTLQRLESGEYENPPIRYLISCAVALGLDDWHLLLEDQWHRPLKGTRSALRRPSADGA